MIVSRLALRVFGCTFEPRSFQWCYRNWPYGEDERDRVLPDFELQAVTTFTTEYCFKLEYSIDGPPLYMVRDPR